MRRSLNNGPKGVASTAFVCHKSSFAGFLCSIVDSVCGADIVRYSAALGIAELASRRAAIAHLVLLSVQKVQSSSTTTRDHARHFALSVQAYCGAAARIVSSGRAG